MSVEKPINLVEVEKSSSLAYIRAAAMLWLDLRRSLICTLSSESGEWMESDYEHGQMIEDLGVMRSVAAILQHQAEFIVAEEETRELIWAVLDEQAKQYGHVLEVPWEK